MLATFHALTGMVAALSANTVVFGVESWDAAQTARRVLPTTTHVIMKAIFLVLGKISAVLLVTFVLVMTLVPGNVTARCPP
jgi:hypothetical protein